MSFVFATCRPGSEPALKREMAARHGNGLTPAFMRPQLITWKAQQPLPPDFRPGPLMTALVSGLSVGMARTVEEAATLLTTLQPPATHLHVFPRELLEDDPGEEPWQRADHFRENLVRLAGWADPKGALRAGDRVADVIIGGEGEPVFIGTHVFEVGDFQTPGGLFRGKLPPEAPSRAWLKMEQALAWLDLGEELGGRTVLELGSAPGGATWSLLNRGAEVWGVDTGEMATAVQRHPRFHHLRMPAGDLKPRMLPPQVDLIVSDMNLEPKVVCGYVEKFVRRLQPQALILTLKINSGKVEAYLPELIRQVRTWAPGAVRVRQLPANRQEVTLVAIH